MEIDLQIWFFLIRRPKILVFPLRFTISTNFESLVLSHKPRSRMQTSRSASNQPPLGRQASHLGWEFHYWWQKLRSYQRILFTEALFVRSLVPHLSCHKRKPCLAARNRIVRKRQITSGRRLRKLCFEFWSVRNHCQYYALYIHVYMCKQAKWAIQSKRSKPSCIITSYIHAYSTEYKSPFISAAVFLSIP